MLECQTRQFLAMGMINVSWAPKLEILRTYVASKFAEIWNISLYSCSCLLLHVRSLKYRIRSDTDNFYNKDGQ